MSGSLFFLQLFWLCVHFSHGFNEDYLHIQALNRACNVGYLYNSITDTIFPVRGIFGDFPANSTDMLKTPSVYMKYSSISKFSDKLDSLNLEASAQATLMFGNVEAGGTANYVKNSVSSSKHRKAVLLYQTLFGTEILSLYKLDVLNTVDMELTKVLGATHFVIGVGWGSENLIEIQYESSSSADEYARSHALRVSGIQEGTSANIQGSLSSLKRAFQNTTKIQFTLYGNFADKISIESFSDIDKFIAEMPKLTKKFNGKGAPIFFKAISISTLKEMIDLNVTQTKSVYLDDAMKRAENDVVFFKLISLMKDFYTDAENQLQDLRDSIHTFQEFSHIFPTNSDPPLETAVRTYKVLFGEMEIKMKYLIQRARQSSDGVLDTFAADVDKFKRDRYFNILITQCNSVMKELKEKILIYKKVVNSGVTFLMKWDNLQKHALQHLKFGGDGLAYFLHFNKKRASNPISWNNEFEKFRQLPYYPRIYVDCDLIEIYNVSCQFVLYKKPYRGLLNIVPRGWYDPLQVLETYP